MKAQKNPDTVIAFECPAMGAEVLEEVTVEPFMAEYETKCNGKKVALFGSYGWGDGQWMRDWQERHWLSKNLPMPFKQPEILLI